jgi:hypothetical protein
MSARLHIILAREAPVGVIFRRGPSRQVQLINWNLKNDSFTPGQWLKARVYERRCDLSPGGTLLIYFAATYKEPLRSWTAVSKPPWFTALALWPKGDGWNGGGRFISQYSIQLNHPSNEAKPHPDFVKGCRKIHVASLAEFHGEDSTVWNATLERDGWKQIEEGIWGDYGATKGFSWKAIKPQIWRKPHSRLPFALEMTIEGLNQTNGPWYVLRYRVLDQSLGEVSNLGLLDWADWSHDGDLLFAKAGCLYRQSLTKNAMRKERLLADFNSHLFEALEAPQWARKL